MQFWNDANSESCLWFIWKLIPVKVEDMFTPPQSPSEALGGGSLPSYGEDTAGQSSARATRHLESERDDLGTIVTEITTTSTVVTTRKRYRVEDA